MQDRFDAAHAVAHEVGDDALDSFVSVGCFFEEQIAISDDDAAEGCALEIGDAITITHAGAGFSPAGLVFSVDLAQYEPSPPPGTPKLCTAYVLGPTGAWRKLGSLYFGEEYWKCNFPGP